MSDDAEHIYELRDEFDAQEQRYERGLAAAAAAEAEDESGTLRVRLDERVPVVTVDTGWRTHHEPSALGAALIGVVAALSTERFEQAGAALEGDAPRARPVPSLGNTAAGQTQFAFEERGERLDPSAMLNRLAEFIDTVHAGIDETFRTVAERSSAARSAESVPGHVTAELRGQNLSALRFDEEWLARADAAQITREANEAIEAAFRRAADETPAQPLDGTPLAEFGALVSDPTALSRYLLDGDDVSAGTTPEGR